MAPKPEDSPLKVRRSILIKAAPVSVWENFSTFERMNDWWGFKTGNPTAGTSKGQWLDIYEPRVGGRIQMSVTWDGVRVAYGGEIKVFTPGAELTFDSDWIPNRGWKAPTAMTTRLSPVLGGTLAELFHYGFEHIGGDFGAEHAGYEEGWGMTQLTALKRISE